MKNKMMNQLRTGVIGVGSMGKNHARVYNEISNLVGVADPDKKQGSNVANEFGVKWYSDYRAMLHDVDAVTIAVPTNLHLKVGEEVIRSGVNLLVEKPLAGNSEDAKKIVNLAEKENVILGVGHIERYNSVVAKAKESLLAGEWGNPLTFSAERFSNYPERIRDVGVLFDLTIHDVDVIRYLADSEVVSVYASGGKARNDLHEDYINLQMNFANGKIGLCQTNWLTPMKVRQLSITTDKSFIFLNHLLQEIEISSSKYLKVDNSNLYKPEIQFNQTKIPINPVEPLKNELADFLDSIIEKRHPLANGSEGIKAVQIVEAGLHSLKTNTVIEI